MRLLSYVCLYGYLLAIVFPAQFPPAKGDTDDNSTTTDYRRCSNSKHTSYHYVGLASPKGASMKCFDCKTQIDDAVAYEAHILCYPCYHIWSKADTDARLTLSKKG